MARPLPVHQDPLLGNDNVAEFAGERGLPQPAGLSTFAAVRITNFAGGGRSLSAYTRCVRLGEALSALDEVAELRSQRLAHLRGFPALYEGYRKREQGRRVTESFGILDLSTDRVYRPDGFEIAPAGKVWDRSPALDVAGVLAREHATPPERDLRDYARAQDAAVARECEELVRMDERRQERSLEF